MNQLNHITTKISESFQSLSFKLMTYSMFNTVYTSVWSDVLSLKKSQLKKSHYVGKSGRPTPEKDVFIIREQPNLSL